MKMVLKRSRFPEIGELVVAQVENIEKMYIYVRLEDYVGNHEEKISEAEDIRARGMVHISELANRWIKNINNFARINQRLVLKVLRVDERKGHIDLSLRRVNKEQKTNKMNEWKYEVKAENLFRMFGKEHDLSLIDMYDLFGWPLIDAYGSIHEAFDAIKKQGKSVVDDIKIEEDYEDLKDEFFELIDSSVQLQQVDIEGQFEIVVYEGNGVDIVKDAFKSVKKIKKGKFTNFDFLYIGAPYYRVKITANDYPTAEKYLKKIRDEMTKKIESFNGTVAFERTD
ncbi:MAG: S1 RNA-binding domain-containing protein [Candidatus Lokiarchaeota archaeon]|nr:S1 RNA-binding domain-containing protein [Candidatus Lokiarchaeota archaeon]